MNRLTTRYSAASAVLALMLAGLLAWSPPLPASPNSPTFTGNARAIQATSLASDGTATTTIIADTGSLSSGNDARDASQLTASAPSLVTAETPSAATISWSNEVDSTASVTNLNVTVGGTVITANSVLSAVSSSKGPNDTSIRIDGLAINGTPVAVIGATNQTVSIPGGQMTIYEIQGSKTTTTTVNALHIVINGAADVVVASSTAGT